MTPTRVLWFRRDLRLGDHPALADAADASKVLPLFVVDPTLLDDSVRSRTLAAYVSSLDADLDGALVVRFGRPAEVVARVAAEVGAASVHISADYAPYGQRRDAAVAEALGEIPLIATGSPYAVAPGRVRKADGSPYRVYTPYYRAWRLHGWRAPANSGDARWVSASGEGAAALTAAVAGSVQPSEPAPPAGENAALEAWRSFVSGALTDYGERRDRPDVRGTSHMSAHLRFGAIHPRTMLADLGQATGDEAYRREIAFREFYADVLFHNPSSTWQSLDRRFDSHLRYTAEPQAQRYLEAWQTGTTGYPIVDAGMRQLRDTGWMHNRVRMIVASFLVKDLHLPWQSGAQWFMAHLRDGDLASNSQGWQWTAGCGTDASPYHRVFNPVTQGKRFDPDGEYVRTYVPELRGLAGVRAHEPWLSPLLAPDYPAPIVDHSHERQTALADFAAMKEATARP